MRTLLLAVAAVAALTGCGDDESDPQASCPTYPVVSGPEGVKDFVVTLDLELMADAEARRELVREVGEDLCLVLTEEKELSLDSVVVDAGIRLDEQGQQKVVDALQAADGVRRAQPDDLATPDGSSDQAPTE